MLSFVALHLLIVLAAGGVLGYEAWTGRMHGATERASQVRGVVFLLATISGASLLIALADGEWLFALALAPITLLSLFRFAMLARAWWPGWRLPVYTSVLVGLGLVLSVPGVPHPLDREALIERLHVLDGASAPPDTIDPEAMRPVRA